MTWSDTPPSEAGWYWVKSNSIGKEFTWEIDQQGLGTLWHASELQFGQRIPSNAKLTELQRKADDLQQLRSELPDLIDDYAEHRAWLGCEDGVDQACPAEWAVMLAIKERIDSILKGTMPNASKDTNLGA